MAIPATSLAAVTVNSTNPGIGVSMPLGAAFSKHAALFTVEDWTGSGSMNLYIEGSLDGNSWFEMTDTSVGSDAQVHIAPVVVLALYVRARAQVGAGTPSATVTGVVVSAA